MPLTKMFKDIAKSGNVLLKNSTSAPSVGNSGTIATAGLGISRVTTAGAVTGVILQKGTFDGQQCAVVNTSANSITMAASGTSNVASGTSCIVAALTHTPFVWSAVNGLWYAN